MSCNIIFLVNKYLHFNLSSSKDRDCWQNSSLSKVTVRLYKTKTFKIVTTCFPATVALNNKTKWRKPYVYNKISFSKLEAMLINYLNRWLSSKNSTFKGQWLEDYVVKRIWERVKLRTYVPSNTWASHQNYG